MNDVLLGGAIALIGSLVGGFVTPLILSRIEERRLKEERERVALETRKRDLGVAIRSLLDALVEVVGFTPVAATVGDKFKAILMAGLDLGLMLEQDDQAVATVVSSASTLAISGVPAAQSALTCLTSVLPAWRRGTLTSWEALDAYRAATGEVIPIPEEARHRKESAERASKAKLK